MLSISDQQKCLISILNCLLCQQRACQAHVCPNCSKFFCLICIKTWMTEKSNQCPYCNQNLQENELINCHKLSTDLSSILESMSHSKQKISKTCLQHNLELDYFCKNCQNDVCSDCCVLSQRHRQHNFVKTNQARKQFERQNAKLKLQIKNSKQNLNRFLIQQKKKSANFQAKIQKDNIKFAQFIKNLKQRSKKKFSSEINSLGKNIQSQKKLIDENNCVYEKNLKFIKECSKVQFVEKQADALQEKIAFHISEIKQSNKSLRENILVYDKRLLESQVLPAFQSKTFCVQNFSKACQQEQIIYTDIFYLNGLEWRLKIYPSGINNDQTSPQTSLKRKLIKQSYISIYIELKKSLRQNGKYRHKVVVKNSKNKDQRIQKEFQSEFDKGECWGYDRFVKISHLYEKGYIDGDSDELRLSLMIAPVNYFEASEDLKALIEEKRKQLNQIKKQRENLKYDNLQFTIPQELKKQETEWKSSNLTF